MPKRHNIFVCLLTASLAWTGCVSFSRPIPESTRSMEQEEARIIFSARHHGYVVLAKEFQGNGEHIYLLRGIDGRKALTKEEPKNL